MTLSMHGSAGEEEIIPQTTYDKIKDHINEAEIMQPTTNQATNLTVLRVHVAGKEA